MASTSSNASTTIPSWRTNKTRLKPPGFRHHPNLRGPTLPVSLHNTLQSVMVFRSYRAWIELFRSHRFLRWKCTSGLQLVGNLRAPVATAAAAHILVEPIAVTHLNRIVIYTWILKTKFAQRHTTPNRRGRPCRHMGLCRWDGSTTWKYLPPWMGSWSNYLN